MAEEKQEEEKELKLTKEKVMTPWEQHSAVISIPRFDYNAPSSLLQHSHSGFLITCPIKREKSATKEAISILSKYIQSLKENSFRSVEDLEKNVDLKRRKIILEETAHECANDVEIKGNTDNGQGLKETSSSSALVEGNGEKEILSLVKLTRSGLLLFIFPKNNSSDSTDIVSQIFHSLESGNLKSLKWCHRIFPVQATCGLNENDLCAVVSNLLKLFLDSEQNKFQKPTKFAVAYNRRGMDETELKSHKSNAKDSNSLALLDRNKCFALVASVIKDMITDSVVDLKSPEFAVLIELLPLSRMPNGSVVVAVSVLPQNLISTKPKLLIKALISDGKKMS
ncbi:hypothetical protein IFM89_013276 [Coptis chinensis]|uniref:THUMP domain-containing protein n=1 Tax=Coptis chinensis TaxID=261450 RepID=A0A835IWS8_9MAGN|nr:hypothetical protein IFM89_013276 [Coptis chinensis]